MDTDGGNSESRQHDRVFLHSFIVLDSLVQAQDSPGRVVGPSVEIHQGMVMDGALQKKWQCFWLWHLWHLWGKSLGKSPHSKVATH